MRPIIYLLVYLLVLFCDVSASLQSELRLTMSQDQIRQGDSFMVTLQGPPDTEYYIWFSQTGIMTGLPRDQPPFLAPDQQAVSTDPESGPFEIGSYLYAGGGGRIIRQDVPYQPAAGVRYYGRVRINANGLSTVRFETSSDTWPGRYAVHVERKDGDQYLTNDVMVRVIERGREVQLSADRSRMVQGECFTLVIRGVPDSSYHLWVEDTRDMSGQFGDQPPVFSAGPSSFRQDNPARSFDIGSFRFHAGKGRSIREDVPLIPAGGTGYYGSVMTDASGSAQVRLVSSSETKPGNYIVRVECAEPGRSEFSTTALTISSLNRMRYSLPLASGWNFISPPRLLAAGNNTMEIFRGVDTAGHSIWTYDAEAKLLSKWRALGADDLFTPLSGYWIYAARATVVPLRFHPYPRSGTLYKRLWYGWNAIGFSDITPCPAEVALKSVNDTWVNVIGYDPGERRFAQTIIHGGSGRYTDKRSLEPGEGYWVYVNGDSVLSGIS